MRLGGNKAWFIFRQYPSIDDVRVRCEFWVEASLVFDLAEVSVDSYDVCKLEESCN